MRNTYKDTLIVETQANSNLSLSYISISYSRYLKNN